MSETIDPREVIARCRRREYAATSLSTADAWKEAGDAIENLIRERDEARACVRRLRRVARRTLSERDAALACVGRLVVANTEHTDCPPPLGPADPAEAQDADARRLQAAAGEECGTDQPEPEAPTGPPGDLTVEEAVALLADGPRVHTFRGFFGADWDRADVLAYLRDADRRWLRPPGDDHRLAASKGDCGVWFETRPGGEAAGGLAAGAATLAASGVPPRGYS